MQNTFTIKTPAKINLYLDVLNKREDGYHNILSLMTMVGLYDRLTFSEIRSGIRLSVNSAKGVTSIKVPEDHTNLVFRVAELVLQEISPRRREVRPLRGVTPLAGVSIHLDKRIPVAAGLGGGSSDAAATLIGLNRLWSLQWSHERLTELAAQLGSDVPFFLHGPTAWVSGKGEQIQYAAPPQYRWAVLVCLPIAVSTASVYQQFSDDCLTRNRAGVSISTKLATEKIIHHYNNQPYNRLAHITEKAFPVIRKVKKALRESGGEFVLMSGSGPTVFALFQEREQADKAVAEIKTTLPFGKTVLGSILKRRLKYF